MPNEIAQRAQLSNERLGHIVESSASEVYIFSEADCRFLLVNRGARDNMQYSMDELRDLTPWDIKPLIARDQFLTLIAPLIDGSVPLLEFETVHRRKDGTDYDVAVQLQMIQSEGQDHLFFAAIQDVTSRKQMEGDLRALSARLDAILNNTTMAVFVMDATQQCIFMNRAAETLTGFTLPETQGRPLHDVIHHSYPDGRPFPLCECAIDRALPERAQMSGEEVFVHKNGHFYPVGYTASPILNDAGAPIGTIIEVRDISEELAARDALNRFNESLQQKVAEAIDERRRVEAQLIQAQKMEAIGQLTGGIAHDFNNLLQVVRGSLELLVRDIGHVQPARQRLDNAMDGVARGAKLVSQLLAFGRQQPLRPQPCDVGRLLRGMNDMLSRALGEMVDVETVVGAGLWNCLIDPAQAENAILNLAINARDAMDSGGKLTIEAGNAALDDRYAVAHHDVLPGQYVMLAVTDTGSGMAPEIVARAFEPFFSTKQPGSGTGLGLSMVYGFIRQSGGHIKIYSEVGVGTTIKLYLPRTRAAVEAETVADPAAASRFAGTGKVILVVEDDDVVRATAVDTLRDMGFMPLHASSAAQALAVIESGVSIDLLFTDVVMPGELRSTELAHHARRLLPGIAVLFTSGYTENSIVHAGRLDEGVELLSKPYARDELAARVDRLLGQAASGPTGNNAPERRPLRVLVVEDEMLIRMTLVEMLQQLGAEVTGAGTLALARSAAEADRFDLIVTDLSLPDGSAEGWVGELLEQTAHSVAIASGRPREALPPAIRDNPRLICLIKPYALADVEACLAALK
jgi:PAS domain S-box-containing protein